MDIIKVSNLSYEVGEKKIIDSISIKVEEGKFIGIMGANGSGKTTLLKHIYRVLPVEDNTIYIKGKDINKLSAKETAKIITVLKQENDLSFDYTNLDMVLMGRTPHKKVYEGKNKDDIKLAIDALRYVGMDKLKDRMFRTLSGGEKQRVLMARSLAQNAEVFILDEPTNHLDVYYQWHMMKLVKNLKKTVIAVFHDLSVALEYCDYIYILKDGKVIKEGLYNEVLDEDVLENVFGIYGKVLCLPDDKYRVIIKGSV